MKLVPLPLEGAYLIELEVQRDERGAFTRTFCRRELEEHGLNGSVAQCNASVTDRTGTLRGLHYQSAPHQEVKLVRCARGAIFDVIVDVRPASPTYLNWHAITLSASTPSMLYIPADFAHGFITLTDSVEIAYQMSSEYRPDAARGLRWDDPALAIEWPARPTVISERDATFPLLVKD